jgi:hypothetical protein
MTTLEHRLTEALLAGGASTAPAPDLFTRVAGSIEDDRVRRARKARTALAVLGILSAIVIVTLLSSERRDGRWLMDWWVFELIVTVILIGIALWLGPFIKRFGRAYAADVFRANPRTGKSYIVLTDIVYYLIFAAYIMFTSRFFPEPRWRGMVVPAQVQMGVYRLAGIFLVIGVLHGLNIVLMPMLGRLFSLNRRLDATHAGPSDD